MRGAPEAHCGLLCGVAHSGGPTKQSGEEKKLLLGGAPPQRAQLLAVARVGQGEAREASNYVLSVSD